LQVFVLQTDWPKGWEKAVSKKARTIESVILGDDIAATIVEVRGTSLSGSNRSPLVGVCSSMLVASAGCADLPALIGLLCGDRDPLSQGLFIVWR
jgi:hypothetical protein